MFSHPWGYERLSQAMLTMLENASCYRWTLQGFGLLRHHMHSESVDDMRLHIWDSRYRVPNVSMIHDHLQWDFESLILSGNVINIRYREDPDGHRYLHRTIKAGVGAQFINEPTPIRLICSAMETYSPGQDYSQKADEIHETNARDGTVTLLRLKRHGDMARVFWPLGTEWVSAVPRDATSEEVKDIVGYALEKWNGVR